MKRRIVLKKIQFSVLCQQSKRKRLLLINRPSRTLTNKRELRQQKLRFLLNKSQSEQYFCFKRRLRNNYIKDSPLFKYYD